MIISIALQRNSQAIAVASTRFGGPSITSETLRAKLVHHQHLTHHDTLPKNKCMPEKGVLDFGFI